MSNDRLTPSWKRLVGDRRGGIAVVASLSFPVIVASVAAAVEYGNLVRRQTQLQLAVDSAALAATQQLRLSNTTDAVVASVAQSVVGSAAPSHGQAARVSATVLPGRTSVQVVASEAVQSVFGKVMTLPSSELTARATAKIQGTTKLCLVTLDVSRNKSLNLDKDSSVTANGCAIYANSTAKAGFNAEENARASATLICSAGGAGNKGAILSPTPTTDCPALQDPLASVPRPSSGFCPPISIPRMVVTDQTLYPGTYCGGLIVVGTARARLTPGIYVMNDGPLIVTNTAQLSGVHVGFFFTGNAGGARLDPDTTISLSAPRDGAMAGLLFFEDRSVAHPILPPPGPKGAPAPAPYGSQPMRQYRITSNNAPTLLGTIYLPAGRLIIDASRPVADRSAYTVIVARQLDLNSGPNLFLNSDYGGTDIPVPDGVGPKSGNVSLTR